MPESSAAYFFKLPAAVYAVAGSTRACDSIVSPAASQRVRSRSRNNDSRLGHRNCRRRIDFESWKQMCDEFSPGHIANKNCP